MPLTSLSTIKKIIQSFEVPNPSVFNERISLSLYEESSLSNTNIDADSESVKIIRLATPYADSNNPITLNAGVPVSLDYQKLVWDSVVVASDAILSTVYVENDDYVIDYSSGTIERSSIGSTIADGGSVYIWYTPFTVLINGDDYNIDYSFGTLNRRAGTSIPNGATVFVDYSFAAASITDDAIEECISQAEAYIEPRLKNSYSLESTDEGLKSAATYFTLYLLSLSQAFKSLRELKVDNADDIARRWNDLSDKYLTVANTHFSKFFNVSSLNGGGLIQNRYVSQRKRIKYSPSVNPTQRRH